MTNRKAVPNPVPGLLPAWRPGASGNPLGGQARWFRLATFVRKSTRDGQEIARFLLEVMRGEKLSIPGRNGGRPSRPNVDQRIRAAELLLDRGWGRAREIIQLEGDAASSPAERMAALRRLSDEDRAALAELLAKALDPPVVDVPAIAESDAPAPAPAPDPAADGPPDRCSPVT